MTRISLFLLFVLKLVFCEETIDYCDILISGGSLSAFAAAISAADRFFKEQINYSAPGSFICLIEPTSWLGG